MKLMEKINGIDLEKIFVELMFTLFGVSTCIVFFFSF